MVFPLNPPCDEIIVCGDRATVRRVVLCLYTVAERWGHIPAFYHAADKDALWKLMENKPRAAVLLALSDSTGLTLYQDLLAARPERKTMCLQSDDALPRPVFSYQHTFFPWPDNKNGGPGAENIMAWFGICQPPNGGTQKHTIITAPDGLNIKRLTEEELNQRGDSVTTY